jgi:hypothetical protein
MNSKKSGSGAQVNEVVAPHVLLTLSILSSNSVPDPLRAVKSFEKADTRITLNGGFGGVVSITFPETFQLVAVSPAACTCWDAKLTTVESKIRSPWKPTKLAPPEVVELMSEVVTG